MNIIPNRNHFVAVVIFFIIVGVLACLTIFSHSRIPNAIINEFDNLYPSIADISGNGEVAAHIKRSNITKRGYNVIIVNDKTKETISLFVTHEPVMRLRLSPDGHKLCCFLQEDKTNIRKLQIWSINERKFDLYNIGDVYAQPSVQWSPDSRRLAFNTPDALFMIVDSENKKQTAFPLAFKAFDWSSNGREIMGCGSKDNKLIRITAENGIISEEFSVVDFDRIHELCWAPYSHPRIRTTKENDTKQYLVEIKETGQEVLHQSTGGFSRIMSSKNGDLLLNEKIDGDRKFCILRSGQLNILRIDGSMTPIKAGDDQCFYIRQVTTTKYDIIKVSAEGDMIDAFTSNGDDANKNIRHETIRIPHKNDSVLLWVAENTSKPVTAFVIIISGGADIYIPPERWTETQMYVNRGYGVIHVAPSKNSDGSEIAMLIDYIQTKFKISESNVAIIAASTSAYSAIGAVHRRPTFTGILVLTSVINVPRADWDTPLFHNKRLRVLAFHGEKDRQIHAEKARMLLRYSLGDTCLSNSQSIWKIFAGEDHSLVNDKNRIYVINSLLECLP
jgi:hypothetical protein